MSDLITECGWQPCSSGVANTTIFKGVHFQNVGRPEQARAVLLHPRRLREACWSRVSAGARTLRRFVVHREGLSVWLAAL
jgi:hypothetical protein